MDTFSNTQNPESAPQNSLERFLKAQESSYPQALEEIRNGRKQTHWIWYIFPQLRGLGHSYNANFYGIANLEEARRYLNHPILGARLREITRALLLLPEGLSAESILGGIDALKVCSCMTLFNQVAPGGIFRQVLERYYQNREDQLTLKALNIPKEGFLLGAVAGDIIGSVYERYSVKRTDFPLFSGLSRYTDDTVMTVAVADWLLGTKALTPTLQHYVRHYPRAGYGGMFLQWGMSSNPVPYHSFGNGSAMRVSPVGWAFDTLQETLDYAQTSAAVTHDHPEGIKGAQAVAACIFLARHGKSKEEIRSFIEKEFGYDLHRTCAEIRPTYHFDVTCQGSVPESIIAFLESTDFESAVRLAVSLGGDADTMGAIAGSIAEAFYGGVPDSIRQECTRRMPYDLLAVLHRFHQKFMS